MLGLSKLLIPFRFLLNSYKKLAFVILPRFYKKIPKLVLGASAAFGFFSLGVIVALIIEGNIQEVPYKDLEEKNEKYLNLISGYEELSKLYYVQGSNFATITDIDLYQTNPADVADAFSSSKEFKDRILIQQGRIMEQRKNAGLLIEESN